MTQFEFIAAAVSIVLALSAARLLTALPHVLAPGRRYWVHALWSMILLAMHLGFWWAIWIYRDIDPWTFRGFVAVMLTPAFLFLAVTALVSDSPATIESWRTHFYARHRAFFSLFTATTLSILLRQFTLLGDASAPTVEGAPPIPLPLMLVLTLMTLAGIVTTIERIHAVLVVIIAGFILFNFAQL
jgi:hypothetical protein